MSLPTLTQAASIIEDYAEYIRSVHYSELERHPYLPLVEDVAKHLRHMIEAEDAITIEAGTDETRSGSAVGESVAIAQNKSERG